MAKEWILNIATNRWGLNKKKSVGPVSHWIREASPRTEMEWQQAYLKKLKQFLQETRQLEISPESYLTSLGQKLYIKITEVLQAEIESITEQDCIDYIFNLVIHRTFEGYQNEIRTIYGQLQQAIDYPIHPTPDEWDREFNVDFYIEVNEQYIGIQIKPISYEQNPEIHKWASWMQQTHQKFTEQFGGPVFIVFSVQQNNKKVIANPEVIPAIRSAIKRLSGKSSQ